MEIGVKKAWYLRQYVDSPPLTAAQTALQAQVAVGNGAPEQQPQQGEVVQKQDQMQQQADQGGGGVQQQQAGRGRGAGSLWADRDRLERMRAKLGSSDDNRLSNYPK